MNRIIMVFIAAIISGCSLRPDMIEIEQEYRYQMDYYSVSQKWWESFGDDKLNILIQKSLQNNSDLLIALNNIEKARINLRLDRLEYLPNISLQGEATKEGMADTSSNNINKFSLSAVLSYELDLWGRVRDKANASQSIYNATKFDYESARISLASSVANTYFLLVSLKEQEQILLDTLNSYIQSVEYRAMQLAAGEIDELIYAQAVATADEARAQLASLQMQISQANSSLVILVGGDLNEILYSDMNVSTNLPMLPEVPSGISSDILLKRADVASALERLKSSNFLVGVARTQWLPQISITGMFGYTSNDLDNLINSNKTAWNVGGSLLAPLIDFGRTYNSVELANLDQNASFLAYDKAVKNAFSEIRTALDDRKNSLMKARSMENLVSSQQKVYDIAQSRYDAGYSSHLELLDSQRNLLSAKLSLSSANLEAVNSIVSVFKAFGGGFEYETDNKTRENLIQQSSN
ncbi:efflux transporter outer membrane subunit [Campylobacter porcelli]|uniref:TolC family protein n=1 Tax=Campylobacter porcelli TaxID=1660073 RepID=A0ABU7M3C6_9BACT|nr:TolC family protein [Campylobacter sp. P0078]MEE3744202.1 TolC family protein [Campylobacter sp. CX2-4855-23]